MKRDMDCVGFTPTTDQILFMRQTMTELQHISPYESYIDAKIKKESSGFSVEFVIKHSDGKFQATHKQPDLKLAILKCAEDIGIQVQAWTENKFRANHALAQ